MGQPEVGNENGTIDENQTGEPAKVEEN